MISLFDENGKYTTAGTALDNEISEVVERIFKNYVERGFSIRDISHIMQSAITIIELDNILGVSSQKNSADHLTFNMVRSISMKLAIDRHFPAGFVVETDKNTYSGLERVSSEDLCDTDRHKSIIEFSPIRSGDNVSRVLFHCNKDLPDNTLMIGSNYYKLICNDDIICNVDVERAEGTTKQLT